MYSIKISNYYFFLVGLLLFSACARKNEPVPTGLISSATPAATLTVRSSTPTSSPVPTEIPKEDLSLTPEALNKDIPLMGMQVYRMDEKSQADLFAESGAEWSRYDYIRWEDVEPKNVDVGQYLWETVKEEALLAAVAGGQRTIANILYTPTWAQKYPGVACGPISKDALDDFAKFMGAVVSRYSVPPYNIKYWEIGNEPDIDHSLVDGHSQYGCWGEAEDPYYGGGYYGEMLKVVYPAIKTADPDSKLVVGGMVMDCDPENPPETEPNSGKFRDCTASRFLEGILETGAGDYFDGVSYHAYDYYYGEEGVYGNTGWNSSSDTTGPVLIAKTRYLRSVLDTYGHSDKKLLNTELAVLCGRSGKEDYCLDDAFANTKAAYVAQANAAALAEGIDVNLWYSLTGWRGSGLIDEKQEPVPAFKAYQYAASWLNKAVYLENIDGIDGIMGYKFKAGEKVMWLVWSLDGNAHQASLPDQPSGVYDIFGNPVTELVLSGTELEVTLAPLYVEWAP